MYRLDRFEVTRRVGRPCPRHIAPEQQAPSRTSPEHERAVLRALQVELRRDMEIRGYVRERERK